MPSSDSASISFRSIPQSSLRQRRERVIVDALIGVAHVHVFADDRDLDALLGLTTRSTNFRRLLDRRSGVSEMQQVAHQLVESLGM